MNPSFDHLLSLLSEMQDELAMRRWGDDVFDRIPQSIEFRTKLFDAILAYKHEEAAKVTP